LQPAIYEAAKEKLRQWKMTEELIESVEASGTPQTTVDVVSNTTGIVTSRLVNEGDYVSQGTPLFTIADLSRVWVLFDAYETDLQYLSKGEKISFTFQALPGKEFIASILFVDPVIDPVTRVAKVRVEIGNQSGKLKPEMFATGIVSSNLSEYGDNVIIPRSAVLWTGKRSLVYVKQKGSEDPVFKMREIGLGPLVGESYVVTDGLSEGEEIVTSGTFSVDAAAQLEGKPSMMNQVGEVVSAGHEHGGVQNMTEHSDMKHEEFEVAGLCEMCKERIENAAKSVRGVASATWESSTREVHIDFNGALTSIEAIRKAIAASGHDNGKYTAPDDVYNSLPACCLYRK
jgi:Cu(I)/Ag(I) efflux system membrane fusion protein